MGLDPPMANPHPVEPALTSLDEMLAEANATVKDQLDAASQLELNRLIEQFSAGWQSRIEHIFGERLADLGARIQARCRAQFEVELAQTLDRGRRKVYADLNQSTRRLRQFENEAQWTQVLVESTQGLAERAALFAVNQRMLELRATRNLTAPTLAPVPIAASPAFSSVLETRDTVVAMRTRGELSEPIAHLVGEAPGLRFSLFPLTAGERVAAILYADSGQGSLETSALEILASFGGAVIAGLTAGGPRQSSQLHTIFGIEPAGARPISWTSLNRKEQETHLRAQRFARTQVAEMRLYQSQAVKQGRADRDLYLKLKDKIDDGRLAFRREFMSASDSMVDYFHLELVRTLANDDADLLGKDYPGPMV